MMTEALLGCEYVVSLTPQQFTDLYSCLTKNSGDHFVDFLLGIFHPFNTEEKRDGRTRTLEKMANTWISTNKREKVFLTELCGDEFFIGGQLDLAIKFYERGIEFADREQSMLYKLAICRRKNGESISEGEKLEKNMKLILRRYINGLAGTLSVRGFLEFLPHRKLYLSLCALCWKGDLTKFEKFRRLHGIVGVTDDQLLDVLHLVDPNECEFEQVLEHFICLKKVNTVGANIRKRSHKETEKLDNETERKLDEIFLEGRNDYFEEKYETCVKKMKNVALSEHPKNHLAHSIISSAYRELGDFSSSLYHINKCIEFRKDYWKGYRKRAEILEIGKFFNESITKTEVEINLSIAHSLLRDKPKEQFELKQEFMDFQIDVMQLIQSDVEYYRFVNPYFLKNMKVCLKNGNYRLPQLLEDVTIIGVGDRVILETVTSVIDGNSRFENITWKCSRDNNACIKGGKTMIINCVLEHESGNKSPIVVSQFPRTVCVVRNCHFRKISSSGTLAVDEGEMIIENCVFDNPDMSSIEFRNGGKGSVVGCEIFGGSKGFLMYSQCGRVDIENCSVIGTRNEGMLISTSKGIVKVKDCRITECGHLGVSVQDKAEKVEIVNCEISNNVFWGIQVKGKCQVDMIRNRIIGNHCGGVRIGLNGGADVLIERNTISKNWFHGVFDEQVEFTKREKLGIGNNVLNQFIRKYLPANMVETHCHYKEPEYKKNKIESNDVKKRYGRCRVGNCLEIGRRRGGCCAFCGNSKAMCRCSECQSVVYCGSQCQKKHWREHRPSCRKIKNEFCEVVMEGSWGDLGDGDFAKISQSSTSGLSAFNLSHPTRAGMKRFQVSEKAKKKGKIPRPDAKKRFVVKVQTNELKNQLDQSMTIYDKSRSIECRIKSERICKMMMMEHGVLGENQWTSKKLYMYAMFDTRFEDGENIHGKKIKIFTNLIAPYPKPEW